MKDHVKYSIWLESIQGIGVTKANKLLKSFGSVKDIYYADSVALSQFDFLSRHDILQILDKKYKTALEKTLDMIYKASVNVVSILDDDYPQLLKNIYDPPIVLYYKGVLKNEERSIAIIGSRKCTSYGLKMAEIISSSLSKLGFVIISGLARGIDSSAHEASIKAGGTTYAILGCGADVIYPPENRNLTEKIIQNGAVISEFVPGTRPLAYNFPQRNRIISGMSLGVIVIEAGERSGSLITANLALEQGREVFALPGNIISSSSVGTNRLIREGAKIITGIDDILDELYIFDTGGKKEYVKSIVQDKRLDSLTADEKKIIASLEVEEKHIDELAHQIDFEIKKLNSMLIVLELNGFIEQIPGKIYRISKTF